MNQIPGRKALIAISNHHGVPVSKYPLIFARSNSLKVKKQLYILLLFIGLSIVLRFFSFFPSVIDHDESTYIILADALLKGHTYFVDYIDTKPIGIFLLIAGLEQLFGSSIFVLRLLAAIILALTAFFLYKTHRVLGHDQRVGVASGVIYLFINSIFTFYGVSPNTETYFNLFTILCLWLILRRRGGYEYLLAGLCLGLGFIIKYVVVFDGLAFGLFLLIEQIRSKKTFPPFWGRALLLLTGFFLPFLTLYYYYYQMGETETFLFHTFTVSGRYPHARGIWRTIVYIIDFFIRFLPVSIFYILGFFRGYTKADVRLLALLWSGCTLFCALLPGNYYGHYFIQFMLPYSFVAGLVFAWPHERLPAWLRWIFNRKVAYPILGLLLIINLFAQKKDYWDKPDYPRIVADYLRPRLEDGDQIYTGNYSQIIYHLLDRQSPVSYVHPSLFWEPKHISALEIDMEKELNKLKEAAPRFIIVRREFSDERLASMLEERYELLKVFEEKDIKIYAR